MSQKLSFQCRTFPSRIADLGFAVKLPSDWITQQLPAESPDFSNPAAFAPLAVVTAPHAAIVFAFAARPAYDDGNLRDWVWYLLKENQLKPRAVGAHQVGKHPTIAGEATQETDLGPIVVRYAFFEDGGRLINITLTAPELLADAVRDAWFAMLDSFTLQTPRGSRFTPENVSGLPASDPAPRPAEEVKSGETVEQPSASSEMPPAENSFAAHALDDDINSLDPETTVNANFRDQGVGLVPRVLAAYSGAKRATVAAGAIMAQFDVPFGWHVIDDGKRVLVFEPSGKIQISLNLISRNGRSLAAVLDVIETETRESYPSPQFMRLKDGNIEALGVRNIHDGAEVLEQYHLLVVTSDASIVLRARVTSTPDRSTDACNLAQLILESVRFHFAIKSAQPEPQEESEPPGSLPDWWHKALALEAQGRLKEAERTIEGAVRHIGCSASIAEMYRLRMIRLLKAGDTDGAVEAFRKSDRWIFSYASQATSGGEGAALSHERDQFRAQLVREFGGDPVAAV